MQREREPFALDVARVRWSRPMSVVATWSGVKMGTVTVSTYALWPWALVLVLIVGARLGAIVFHDAPPRMRALFGGIGTLAGIAVGVRIMGALGVLTPIALFSVLALTTLVLCLVRRQRRLDLPWSALLSRETLPIAMVAGASLIVAALAAYLVPIWQWDALGYHLPYVNFALQRGSLADVPRDVPYLATYPHVIEYFFIAWRAVLPNDTLVDAAQIPLGLLGAGAIACLAREFGARRDHSIAAGLVWLSLPAVFLQLPTNYVDVGCAALLLSAAAFTLAEPTPRNVIAAGIALGLFLGSKPNAPVGTALMLAALGFRAQKARLGLVFVASTAIVLVLGAESYVINFARHGNPVWPVRVSIGPFELPGNLPMQDLLDSGPMAPRLHGPLPLRIVQSWTSLDAPPIFDMRYGGLGLTFLAALPLAAVAAYRRRNVVLALVVLATLASPDPSMVRYVLPFPGIVLALGAAGLEDVPASWRRWGMTAVAAAAVFGITRAYPGLTGEGPPLTAYLHMSPSERIRAVGADGRPTNFHDALDRLGHEDETAFDASFHLPYFAWPSDLSCPSTRIPDNVDRAAAEQLVDDPRIRLLIVDRKSLVADIARSRGNLFTELFQCKASSCIVLLRS